MHRRAVRAAATVAVAVLLLSRLVAGGSGGGSGDEGVGGETEAARREARRLAKQTAAATAVEEATKRNDRKTPAEGSNAEEEGGGEDEPSPLTVWRLDGSGRRWVQVLTGMSTSRSSAATTTDEWQSESLPAALQASESDNLLAFPSPFAPDTQTAATSTTTRGSYPPGSWLTQSSVNGNISSIGGEVHGGLSSYPRACATREMTSAELTAKESKRRVASIQRPFNFKIDIPVLFHVIHDGVDGYLTEERLRAQVKVLTDAFSGATARHDGTQNADASDTGVTFRFAGARYKNIRDPSGTVPTSWFRDDCSPGSGERRIKAALAETPDRVINVYTCEPNGGVLGWISAFPDELPESDAEHGVFLLHSSLPGGGAVPYNFGDTAVHEIGHYLGGIVTFETIQTVH